MNHDAAYTHVFQNRTMTELLLRAWLPSDVSGLLDYSSLRSEPTKGFDEDGRQRTGDLLFSIKMKSGGTVWLALLVEFQSSCDQMMAWRMLSYAALFWRRAEGDRRLQNGRLPAVLPVVLYNGRAPWTATKNLEGCVNLAQGSPLWRYMPNLLYLLIDVHRESPERLAAMQNPVGWAMLMEQSRTPSRARELATLIDSWCRLAERSDVRDSVRLLVRELVLAGRNGAESVELPPLTEKERDMSLAENLDSWMAEWSQHVRDEGREQGRAEERHEAQITVNKVRREKALLALEMKFGVLGLRFWQDHFGAQQFGNWEELVSAVKKARTLDDLHRFRPDFRKPL